VDVVEEVDAAVGRVKRAVVLGGHVEALVGAIGHEEDGRVDRLAHAVAVDEDGREEVLRVGLARR